MNIKKRFLACAIAVAVTGAGLPYYNKTISEDVKITASASTTVLSESQLSYEKFADYVQITQVKNYLDGNTVNLSSLSQIAMDTGISEKNLNRFLNYKGMENYKKIQG